MNSGTSKKKSMRYSRKGLRSHTLQGDIARWSLDRYHIGKLYKLLGKNAVLKGTNFTEGATAKERNRQIGGHKA